MNLDVTSPASRRRTLRRVVPLVAAAVVPGLVGAAVLPVRGRLAPPTVALLLVVTVVVFAAVSGRRFGAVLAAVSATLAFDVLHTRPYGSFTIARGEDAQTAVLLLLVAAVVGEVAAWGRRHHRTAEDRAVQLSHVYGVSSILATDDETPDFLVLAVAQQLADLLHLHDCRFERQPLGRPLPLVGPDGEVTYAGARWAVEKMGFPAAEVELPVSHRNRTVGRYVLSPERGRAVPLEHRRAAVALTTFVAADLATRVTDGAAGARDA